MKMKAPQGNDLIIWFVGIAMLLGIGGMIFGFAMKMNMGNLDNIVSGAIGALAAILTTSAAHAGRMPPDDKGDDPPPAQV